MRGMAGIAHGDEPMEHVHAGATTPSLTRERLGSAPRKLLAAVGLAAALATPAGAAGVVAILGLSVLAGCKTVPGLETQDPFDANVARMMKVTHSNVPERLHKSYWDSMNGDEQDAYRKRYEKNHGKPEKAVFEFLSNCFAPQDRASEATLRLRTLVTETTHLTEHGSPGGHGC
jgi:hypothetical protein